MVQNILIVDDDPTQRRLIESVVTRLGHKVLQAGGGREAVEILNGPQGGDVALVMLDLVMPEMDGIAVLSDIKPKRPHLPVIVLTAKGGIDTVVGAMRAGADDFMVKPAAPERIQVSIQNALRLNALSSEISRLTKRQKGKLTFEDIVAKSPAMQQVIRLGRRAAASNIPILIGGESGVGKEVIARAIQGESERSGKPFVTVNCGAIPENLVESILFGHEKGAFTGAMEKHAGKFQEANGGTLFLDEIGELRLDMQVKLLRALQEGEIDPVGAKKPIKVDIRFISATNRDLLAMARDGTFREDLYYRLNVFPIEVASLRDRAADIPDLIDLFMRRFAAEEGKKVSGIDGETLDLLCRYDWPGNVRQLENAVFRAVVLSDSERLTIEDFPQIAQFARVSKGEWAGNDQRPAASADIARPVFPSPAFGADGTGRAAIRSGPVSPASAGMPVPFVAPGTGADPMAGAPSELQDNGLGDQGTPDAEGGDRRRIRIVDESGHMRTLEDIEGEMIRLAIDRYAGHMSEVARRLGIGRSTLYRKVRELGLDVRAQSTG
ncbi:MAG: sigma-54-dependent transcriptional regulator [Alphaproteobacteria bacterium]